MESFARETAQKQLLSVVHADSQILIRISAHNAIYQASLHKQRLPRFFDSLHLHSLPRCSDRRNRKGWTSSATWMSKNSK